ncbi:MAG TPA: ABC-2 family transporter protein [Deinococcales bacterium]|nr:ABC-2 family transporter protein [Deinococcales bacterium]
MTAANLPASPWSRLKRRAGLYWTVAGIVPRLNLTYRSWFYMDLFTQGLALVISVAFWQAVFAASPTVGGLGYGQTISYIILALVLMPLAQNDLIFTFGRLAYDGSIAVELMRPVDFQAAQYTLTMSGVAFSAVTRLPVLALGVLAFGLKLPADPWAYAAFAASLALGGTLLFFFDWMLACLAFFTTEVWGLGMLRFGVSTFLSGGLIPLAMMPGALRDVCAALPFAQAVYVPVSFLTGMQSVSSAPRVLLVQAAWTVALAVASRFVFRFASRRAVVQGG